MPRCGGSYASQNIERILSVEARFDGRPPVHPAGTLVRTVADETVFVLRGAPAVRYAIPNPERLYGLYDQSYPGRQFDFKDVIYISDEEMLTYPYAGVAASPLPGNGRPQPDGKLIRRVGGQEISIITDNGRRRGFPSLEVFTKLGFVLANVVEAADYDTYPAATLPVTGTAPAPTLPAATGPVTVLSDGQFVAGSVAQGTPISMCGGAFHPP